MKCDLCDGYGMLAPSTGGTPPTPWPVWQAKHVARCGPAAVANVQPIPCPRCGGTGISHCCEGDRCAPGNVDD